MYNIFDDITNQLNNKQDTLRSGSNLKTINNTSVLGAGDIAVGTVTSVTGTAPITSTGGNTPAIGIPQANGSTNGFLASTDWTTFNSKTRLLYNASILPQVLVANTTTYLTNSNLSANLVQAGTIVTWFISITKTAAGTAAPVFTIRFGTAASTADSTLVTFTGSAQTAAADTGMVMIRAVFRATGNGTAIISAHYNLTHNLASTGLANVPCNNNAQLSGTFNSTTANSFLGITVNSGASAIWTINQVDATIQNLI